MPQTDVEKYHQKNSALRVNGLADHQSIISTKTESRNQGLFLRHEKQMAEYISLRTFISSLPKPTGIFHCPDFFSELIELLRDLVSCGCSKNAHLLRISDCWSYDSGSYALSDLKKSAQEDLASIHIKELPEIAQW